MVKAILFPSDYFNPNEVDSDLKTEYTGVIGTGLFDVIIFNYDKWFNGESLVLNKKPNEEITAVYRGWMMKPEKYAKFYNELLNNNIKLITTPKQYERFHIFPNIYNVFGDDTAKMFVYLKGEKISVDEIKKNFSKFMIKDYVKSVKGTDFPKFFDSSITQEDFDDWMKVFYKYRGELFTGGICVKEYLDLKKYSSATNEYRVFYANNNILSVSKNSGQLMQPYYVPELPKELAEKYKNMDSPFYTVDFAETANNEWKVVEAGDGQVSGLSDFQDEEAFFRGLYKCFEE